MHAKEHGFIERSAGITHPIYLSTHGRQPGAPLQQLTNVFAIPKATFLLKKHGTSRLVGKSNMAAPMASRHVATTW